MIRSRMIMRAIVERNATATKDGYGGSQPPVWQEHATVPCWAWSTAKRDVEGHHDGALIQNLQVVFPKASDVTEADRVARIEDRQGAVLFAGPMKIVGLQPRPRHLEAMLKRVH